MHSPNIQQKIFEVSLALPQRPLGASGVIKGVLMQLGISQHDIIEQEMDGRTILAFYCQTRHCADSFVLKLSRLKWHGMHVRSGVLYQDDWLTRWKKDWKPFALTKRIDMVPVWCQDDYVFGKRAYILLDTISSFGTGLHETTRFMAQFVDGLRGEFDSCLDIGTGTGVLALVALKGGANEVHAVDVDEMCVHAASANFKANGYSDRLISRKDILRFKTKKPFDLSF